MYKDKDNFLEVSSLDTEALEVVVPEQDKVVRQIGSEATGEVIRMKSPERHYLADHAQEIKALVSGHDEDIDSIMHAISGQAFRDPSEPFSILITGPEGSGKTETAQAMADVLADGECMKIDCSQFNGAIDPSVAIVSEFVDAEGKLVSPSGEEGSPAIIVFENIEEADENFINYLASGPMAEGKFTLTVPQQGIFSVGVDNGIFVFTSRLGTGSEEPTIGYRITDTKNETGRKSREDIKKSADNNMKIFGDKFLDNVGHRVYYEALSDEDLGDVLDGHVQNRDAYEKFGIGVDLSEEVRDDLVRSVVQNKRNATTVIKQYQKLVEPNISRMAANGDIPVNHKVYVEKDEDGEYQYSARLDPDKLANELNTIRQSLDPLMERYEELVEMLESQGIGLDADGHPLLDN